MNVSTPSRAGKTAEPTSQITPSHTNNPPDTPKTCKHSLDCISELSALPISPAEPLTPPDSDPFKKHFTRANTQHQTPTSPTSPTTTTTTTPTTQDPKLQLIAEQQWKINLLTSQRAIDRQSISRLEADRERIDEYHQQHDGHQNWIRVQWANGIEEIARRDRCLEELQESEKVRFEKQVQESHAREGAMRQRIEELQREVGWMEGVAQERAACDEVAYLERLRGENAVLLGLVADMSRRDTERGLKSCAMDAVFKEAVAEREDARIVTEELESVIMEQIDSALRSWDYTGSLLVALVIVVVLVEFC